MGGFDIILFEVTKNQGRQTLSLGPETMKVAFGNSVPMATDEQSQDGVDQFVEGCLLVVPQLATPASLDESTN